MTELQKAFEVWIKPAQPTNTGQSPVFLCFDY